MLGAGKTLAADPHIADLTEAAVFVEIFMETAFGRGEGVASLSSWIVELVNQALAACSVDSEVSQGTDAGLSIG